MTVYYEWDVEETETIDGETEIVEHWFQTSYKDCLAFSAKLDTSEIVLVRDDDHGKLWAYMQEDGTLPEFFANAWGKIDYCTKVPKRFHEEVRKFKKCK